MEKYISKEEAQKALIKGKAVGHKSYLTNQFFTLNTLTKKISFNLGGTVSEHIFWFHRMDECWDTGWYIVE
jgi:hypothetical protein